MERERALHNWKRLVDSLEKASLAPSDSRVFHVPSSLAAHDQITSHESDITKILEVADEIEPQNSDVALILYEHAFAKSQSLDPNSEGRGVLQFKTGLMSYIKQKRASERGTPVHPKGDERYRMDSMYTLQKFYEGYRREHLDLILEDSLATADIKKLEERKLKRQKVLTTLRVLKDVVEMYAKKHPEEAERVLTPQFKNLLKADAYYLEALIPYNILPLEGPGESTLFALPELKAAREVLEVPHLVIRDGFQRPQHRQQDVFDALEVAFGFQPDNIKNQREHLVLLLVNAQSRSINPNKVEDEDKRSIVDFLCPRILDNYENWCLYIREQCVYERAGESSLTLKVALMALYLCIWGEAANVRFLPECICYIYHNMANELRAMLTGGHIEPSQSLRIANGGKKELRFLEEVIQPIYEALAVEAKKSNGGKEPHSRWRNYDDFNEFFWSRSCFHKLKWPIKDYSGSSFFSKEKGQGKSSGKTSFVEHRTFLHLYHSFVRVWILLVMMLQALGIIAFNDNFDFNTVKILLSLGPTYFVMKFIESVLDIVLMVGAYFSSRRSAIIRIFVHFFWYGGCTVGFSYLYIKTWQDPTGFFLKVYLWALGSYAGVKLFLSLIQHLRSVQQEVRKTSKSRVVETLKWLYQLRYQGSCQAQLLWQGFLTVFSSGRVSFALGELER